MYYRYITDIKKTLCIKNFSGAGINVANSKPTVCLNDFLPTEFDNLLTVEAVIAETMNKLECKSVFFIKLEDRSNTKARNIFKKK